MSAQPRCSIGAAGDRPTIPAAFRTERARAVRRPERMPPLTNIPITYFLGLAPDQCSLLAEMCEGRSLAITSPGGTGKSMVLGRYAKVRKELGGESVEMTAISVDPHSGLAEHMTVHTTDRASHAVAQADAARAEGRTTILFVEEHTAFDEVAYAGLDSFDQVLIVGDVAQGNYDATATRLRQATMQRSMAHRAMHIIWRSYNNAQFNMLNAVAYQGRYESYGTGAERVPDTIRATVTTNPAGIATAGRLMRHLISNRTTTIAQVVSSREQAIRAVGNLVYAAKIRTTGHRYRIVHRSLIQGIEADVVMMDAQTFDLTAPDEIEKFMLTSTGRARFRTEIALDETWLDRDHAVMATKMLGYRYETIPADPESTPYAAFARKIEAKGLLTLRAGLSHITLTQKDGNVPILLINVLGDDPIEAIHKQEVAQGKKWRVATGPLTIITELFHENNPEIETLTSPLLRPTAPG